MLDTLYLENNRLNSLPPQTGAMPRLKYLRLNRNLLETVPATLAQAPMLESLSLEDNPLRYLPEALQAAHRERSGKLKIYGNDATREHFTGDFRFDPRPRPIYWDFR